MADAVRARALADDKFRLRHGDLLDLNLPSLLSLGEKAAPKATDEGLALYTETA